MSIQYRYSAIVVVLLLTALLTTAQESLTAHTIHRLNVRQAPSLDATLVTTLELDTSLVIEGRNEAGDWLFVRTPDGAIQGWIAVGFVWFRRPVRIIEDIPVRQVTAPAVIVNDTTSSIVETTSNVTAPNPNERTTGPALWLGSGVINNVRRIYAQGQARGRNPAMLMFVGDSNLALGLTLCNLGRNNYDMGTYAYLQPIVDYFNTTGAFCRENVSAQVAFTTYHLFDSTWAPNHLCGPNVIPLDCEIQRSNATYGLIYLGIQDLELIVYQPDITYEDFRANLTQIVNYLSTRGVIPILATFPTTDYFHPEGARTTTINNVIREVAQATQVPLIDVRAVTFGYPNHGADADGYHLSTPPDGRTSFNGNEFVYGRTRYELLALELLNQLHQMLNG